MHPTNHYNIQRTNQASHRTSMYLLSGISAYFPIQTAPKVLALGSPCGALGRNTCVLKPLMASILYRKGISIDSVDCGSSCSNHGTSNKTANQTSELAAQTPFKKKKITPSFRTSTTKLRAHCVTHNVYICDALLRRKAL